MGHVRLGALPRTRRWGEVVGLIQHGATMRQVANAAIRAAERGLMKAPKDKGVVEALWRLIQLPRAARADDYPGALYELGLPAEAPGIMALVAGLTVAVDRALPGNKGRTDLGEMAQMAASESLTDWLGERCRDLFGGAGPEVVQAELSKLATVKAFGTFARRFFARLTYRGLNYFLSRALGDHVGPGKRFLTLPCVRQFTRALELHCEEAAAVVERFSGEWASKTRWQKGTIGRDDARDYAHGALSKIFAFLKWGERADVP